MAQVHPSAVVDKEARLADMVTIGPNCVVGAGVSVGPGTALDANVIITGDVRIGKNNHFFANCVIGCQPQILGMKQDAKIGGMVIGDNNVIREQVTIHPSIYPGKVTSVGNDNLLMVGVHIGHDCMLEDKIVISNYSQIGGHCKIETGVWMSAIVGLHQFVTVGKWSYAAGLAGISRDVPPFLIVSGHYPQRIRGVNKRGLQRAGLTDEQQHRISEAYRKLYRRGGSLLENAEAMARQNDVDENVQAMIDMIIKSSQHRFGRYLETFRH